MENTMDGSDPGNNEAKMKGYYWNAFYGNRLWLCDRIEFNWIWL